jgi:hypothetical protein
LLVPAAPVTTQVVASAAIALDEGAALFVRAVEVNTPMGFIGEYFGYVARSTLR